ncbi:40S ribosomal protein S27-like protein [Blastocystis sp. subtype 4]|uniref:40S ribosomal protein S27-like protein n=1 Tax=Blastocystis sp. subtype 4 TaxID=944170 RepID=UPI000711E403|nr:40S ribosomal protein S27-like protein [Blastocystis sp. subtype 4]KNB43133.1 40S ribosomal protein S27-like protein [Blastocystis sp. subtype 4]|eukprot:XP_014526576.1 40S ribosomal protein S27-like protein [Blastocystis sp. subtype 4]
MVRVKRSFCKLEVNDLRYPSAEEEAQKHKLKRLVQTPNSYFMDVRCPGCFNITTVFSHAQSVVVCDK